MLEWGDLRLVLMMAQRPCTIHVSSMYLTSPHFNKASCSSEQLLENVRQPLIPGEVLHALCEIVPIVPTHGI